ncbi:UBP-type zinc finger domain-containing protein [Kitasatospora sp. NPDC094015]|uniref:UBP-type zinc finger domain-containing protein n=1 Tax=Kitasatospora sp. NPDC094015 TaxID=3155205 RepID=UPI00332FD477
MAEELIPGIDPTAQPSGEGCADCLAAGGWWLHLRRCAACGRIGCCDSSPAQHASAHARSEGHPFITSFEPGEDWFWNVETEEYYEGPELAGPQAHPVSQPTPGPGGSVPADWREHLH